MKTKQSFTVGYGQILEIVMNKFPAPLHPTIHAVSFVAFLKCLNFMLTVTAENNPFFLFSSV